jgi:hypothetical protein
MRRVVHLIERTIDRHGQTLLMPEFEFEGWLTSLDLPVADIVRLYRDHGTHEQFHSEFKTDLDLERLPSGKFATNDLVLSLAVLAFNILRAIGQATLISPDSPVRHPAKRRRIRTVMQEIIGIAAWVSTLPGGLPFNGPTATDPSGVSFPPLPSRLTPPWSRLRSRQGEGGCPMATHSPEVHGSAVGVRNRPKRTGS